MQHLYGAHGQLLRGWTRQIVQQETAFKIQYFERSEYESRYWLAADAKECLVVTYDEVFNATLDAPSPSTAEIDLDSPFSQLITTLEPIHPSAKPIDNHL